MKKLTRIAALSALLTFSGNAASLGTDGFLELTLEQQTFYVMGIINMEMLDASYGPDRNDCLRAWNLEGAAAFLHDWYEKNPQFVGKVTVTFLLSSEMHRVCPGNK